MNGKQRILAKLRGEPTDSLPLMPITMMFAADLAGARYIDYASDHAVLADAQVRIADHIGFDYVSAISDPAREASDLGATIEWFPDQPPAIVESHALLADKCKLATLRLPDPAIRGRMRDRVEAVRLLAELSGDTRIVEGWVEGPCAMSADLRGLNTLMLDFFDDPPFVEALFDFTLRMEVEFASAQVAAGATLIGVGDAASVLLGLGALAARAGEALDTVHAADLDRRRPGRGARPGARRRARDGVRASSPARPPAAPASRRSAWSSTRPTTTALRS